MRRGLPSSRAVRESTHGSLTAHDRLTGEVREHEGLAQRPQARRNCRLPLARPAAHLGKLADPERHALVRPAGDGRLEVGCGGAAVRAPGARAYGASRGRSRRAAARHKYGTVGKRADCRGHKKRRHDCS